MTPDEQGVFNLIQTITYAVIESKVLTTKGKEIVFQNELTSDARATSAALLNYHCRSTASTIAARNIMGLVVVHGLELVSSCCCNDGIGPEWQYCTSEKEGFA